MILLDTAVNAMNDATFTLRDVIYIIVLLGGAAGAYFAIKMKLRETDLAMEKVIERLKSHEENFLAHKASAKARREEFKREMEKRMDTFQGDNVREIMKLEDQLSKFMDSFSDYAKEQQKFREEVLTKLATRK